VDTSYTDQLLIIADLRLKEGQTHRGNCPFCGGRNTFTATKQDGKTVWNCFRASCGARGTKGGTPPVASIKRQLDGLVAPRKPYPEIPQPLTRIENQKGIIAWLKANNSFLAYEQELVTIRYSPKDDRIMFKINSPIMDEEGWVGRARRGIIPKWKKYGDCHHLLTVGTGPVGVIVEDACSACAVGVCEEYTGIALLGTNLTKKLRIELKEYSDLIVCLDPDAAVKSLMMQKQLSGIHNVDVCVPPNDLKYYTPNDVRRILGNTTTKTNPTD
jgi:hypothetical protein